TVFSLENRQSRFSGLRIQVFRIGKHEYSCFPHRPQEHSCMFSNSENQINPIRIIRFSESNLGPSVFQHLSFSDSENTKNPLLGFRGFPNQVLAKICSKIF